MSNNLYQLQTSDGDPIDSQPKRTIQERLLLRVSALEQEVERLKNRPEVIQDVSVADGTVSVQQLAAQVWLAMQPNLESRLTTLLQQVQAVQQPARVSEDYVDRDQLTTDVYNDVDMDVIYARLAEKLAQQVLAAINNEDFYQVLADLVNQDLDAYEIAEKVAELISGRIEIHLQPVNSKSN